MYDFDVKRNALFDCLDDASSELKGTLLDQSNLCTVIRTDKGELEMSYRQGETSRSTRSASKQTFQHLRGKESIFKKPELPIARCLKPRKLPDYQINPHKWKKYSLEDVDISDRTNSSAALEFLREIQAQKDATKPKGNWEREQKIEFKKSCKIRRNLKSLQYEEQFDAEIDSPKLKGSKLVMPEYVVGQTKARSTFKRKSYNASKCNNEKKQRPAGKLLLSHLQEHDEEDEGHM